MAGALVGEVLGDAISNSHAGQVGQRLVWSVHISFQLDKCSQHRPKEVLQPESDGVNL